MKSFIKKIANSRNGIQLRNLINFKPVKISTHHLQYSASVSDAFCWRTDNGFTTIFKYSDILDLFYKIKNSSVELHFYSNKGEFLKKLNFQDLNYSNKLTIDDKLLGGIKDYGIFYIYHNTSKQFDNKTIISNRCYLGYSQNNNLYSFVHGNTYANFQNFNNKKNKSKFFIIQKSLFNNQIYKIQSYFNNLTKSQLFFSNPTSEIINFSINNKKYILKKENSTLVDVSNIGLVEIKSNCFFLRPIVFSSKNEYLNVYHS